MLLLGGEESSRGREAVMVTGLEFVSSLSEQQNTISSHYSIIATMSASLSDDTNSKPVTMTASLPLDDSSPPILFPFQSPVTVCFYSFQNPPTFSCITRPFSSDLSIGNLVEPLLEISVPAFNIVYLIAHALP